MTVKALRAATACAAFLICFAGCRTGEGNAIVARVNGDPISAEEFRSRMKEYRAGAETPLIPSSETTELKKRVLSDLIDERILLAEARARQVAVSPEELSEAVSEWTRDFPPNAFEEMLASQKISRSRWRQRVSTQLLMDKVMRDVTRDIPLPSSDEIAAFYKANAELFRQEEQLRLQQIVVKSRADAERILEELNQGASFDNLARLHSFTPEAGQGGNLGLVARGTMPAPIDAAIEKLQVGKPSAVIESEYGFHVVRVVERKSARILALEEARTTIQIQLTQQERDRKFAAWRKDLLYKSKIERNNGLLAALR